jgi:hypothetical protein
MVMKLGCMSDDGVFVNKWHLDSLEMCGPNESRLCHASVLGVRFAVDLVLHRCWSV